MPGLFSAPSGCCCDLFYDVICIYNSNAICDHDFDVFLNSTLIGNRDGCISYPGSAADCKASMWSKNQVVNSTWIGFPTLCNPVIVETFNLDTSLFITGMNELKMVTTNTNNIDNYGNVIVARVQGTTLIDTFLHSIYSSGYFPTTFTFNFLWAP